MPFKTVHFCTMCDEEVAPNDMLKHEQVDCSHLPQNVAKAEAEHAAWEKRWNEIKDAWDAWQEKREEAKRPIINAIPSVDYKPRSVAYVGKCVLVDFNEDDEPVVSKVLTNPTWGTVLVEFDKAIFFTEDTHHCFLEGLQPVRRSRLPKDIRPDVDVQILHYCTGS